MAKQLEKREIYNFYNDLTCLIKSLAETRQNVYIELKNKTCLIGFVKEVDGFMNIFMEKLVLIDLDGRQYKFDDFFVHRRYIKYIEIPHNMDVKSVVTKALNEPPMNKINQRKPHTFKRKRAELNHIQTIKELQK